MPILFSAIACDRQIISHFACCDGNFMEITDQVMCKLPPGNSKMTYSHGTYLLHYIANDNYVYFCITDKLWQRSRTFLFLNEIQRKVLKDRDLKSDLTTTLAAEMYRYSEDYSTITIRSGELDDLNKIGVGSSEDLLGEKILYVNNPDQISYSTISYVSCTPERISVSFTPKWYIVVIGMAIFFIALAVYAFGPISCAVVIAMGIFTLLRRHKNADDKLKRQ